MPLSIYDAEWDKYYEGKYRDNYAHEYDSLCDSNRGNLFFRQVIGYLQRSLPAVDRFAFADGFYDLEKNKTKLPRDTKYRYQYKNQGGTFPDVSCIASDSSGLGFDYGIYSCQISQIVSMGCGPAWGVTSGLRVCKTSVKQKCLSCKTYAAALKSSTVWVCNVLMMTFMQGGCVGQPFFHVV